MTSPVLVKPRMGRPFSKWRVTDAEGNVFEYSGAAQVAAQLGVARQTIYNLSSRGLEIKGCRVESVHGEAE